MVVLYGNLKVVAVFDVTTRCQVRMLQVLKGSEAYIGTSVGRLQTHDKNRIVGRSLISHHADGVTDREIIGLEPIVGNRRPIGLISSSLQV